MKVPALRADLGGGYTFTDSEAETQTLDKKTQQYVVTTTPWTRAYAT